MIAHSRTYGVQFQPSFHRPFLRYIEGEQGGAPTPPPAEQPPAAPPAPAPAPQPAPPAPPAPKPPAEQPPVNYRGNPDEYVRELREEAKNHRLAAEKAQQERDAVAAERDTTTAARDALARENHLLRVAGKYGANPDMLLDSSSFMTAFKDVDLADEAKVKEAIEQALEKNSAFRAGPALPPMSGGGHQGGAPQSQTPTLEGALARRYGG